VRTAKETPHCTFTKFNWLMLFRKVIGIFTENHTKPININEELLIVGADKAYNCH
jgi:hypothetical protein